jgi:hypothetical protein
MKKIAIFGAVLSMASISAAASPTDYRTYFGSPVDASPVIQAQFYKAADHCEAEASSLGRGSPDLESYSHIVAVRGCLARYNFIDRGAYATLPIVLGLDHFLDR